MVASMCTYKSSCRCGATGCDSVCDSLYYLVSYDSCFITDSTAASNASSDSVVMVTVVDPYELFKRKPRPITLNIDLSFLHKHPIYKTLSKIPILIRRIMFSKSGHLPKRIRRIRKGV